MSSALAALGEVLLAWIVPLTIATGAILAVALVVDHLLERRIAASVRLWLYGAVLARLALPGPWQSPLGLLGRAGPGQVIPGEPTVGAGPVGLASTSAAIEAGWVALGYLLVAAVLLGLWLQARLALRRRLAGATPLGREIEGISVLGHPQLGPLVAGLRRPRIIVPAALAQAGQGDALDCVLRHERAHIARRDLLVGALVQLVCIAAWPVLPVWIAARRMRALMEVACDERAVRDADGTGRRRYGEVLLALAEGAPAGHPLAPVLSFGSPLKARLRALAARRRWPVLLQGLVVGALGAAVVACAAEPAPRTLRPVPDAAPEGTGGDSPPGSARAGGRATPIETLANPEAIPDRANVRGSLDKEIIRRVIRRHMDEVKACYERRLTDQPGLEGRVSVQFTIAATGAVSNSALAQSSMKDAAVEQCLVLAVRGWEFPRPEGGGIVVVTYPFTFTPGGDAPRDFATRDIRTAVESRREQIRTCYVQHPPRSPDALARLTVDWTVQQSGEISESTISGKDAETALAGCIAGALRGVRLPPLAGIKGPLKLSFPFYFQPMP